MGEGETLGKGVWGSSDRPLRSVWGAAGSDTQVPEALEAPSPAKRSPKLGERWEAGRRKRPFSSGTLGGRLERRTGGQGTPKAPSQPGQDAGVRFPAPPGKWGAPLLFPPCLPQRVSSKPESSTRGSRQRPQPSPSAAHSLLPRRRREGGDGRRGGSQNHRSIH